MIPMSNASPVLAALIAVVCALAVIDLIAYARGPEHYRGDEVGTHGTKVIVVRPAQ
jgi:hypothetical protein